MSFFGDVVVKEKGDEGWVLVQAIRYVGNRDTFDVPAGFETDFASVPRVFVWLIPKYGKYTKAAILHDWLCDESKAGRFDRADADGTFRRAMRELGVSFLRRWLMWAAVASATLVKSRRFFDKRTLQLVVIAIPAIAFMLIPAVVVTAWLALFWLIELAIFLVLKPFSAKRVNPPKFTWKLA